METMTLREHFKYHFPFCLGFIVLLLFRFSEFFEVRRRGLHGLKYVDIPPPFVAIETFTSYIYILHQFSYHK